MEYELEYPPTQRNSPSMELLEMIELEEEMTREFEEFETLEAFDEVEHESMPSEPPAEYTEEGRLTAQSKGKANMA